MARASLYKDPETIRLVTDLDKRGHSGKAIAERMGISHQTVRKILEPGYAAAERKRGREVDKDRAPLRRQDPAYQEYHAKANDSDAHRERARRASAVQRHGPTRSRSTNAVTRTANRGAVNPRVVPRDNGNSVAAPILQQRPRVPVVARRA